MPELPEVETTRRGIAPEVEGRMVSAVVVHNGALRWPVPADLPELLRGQSIVEVARRAKYLLLVFGHGRLLVHLGMSGQLRVCAAETPLRKHDHVELRLDSGQCLRLHDPRRFGCVLWEPAGENHPLLQKLGPEPLGEAFDADYLHHRSRGRRVAIKPFLMDAAVVVGVGNIYASEALFMAGIDPRRPAGRISRQRYENLARAVRSVLGEAIRRGGTTLRDYVSPLGEPGWFKLELKVYERGGLPCLQCAGVVQRVVLGQRASYYCPGCQR